MSLFRRIAPLHVLLLGLACGNESADARGGDEWGVEASTSNVERGQDPAASVDPGIPHMSLRTDKPTYLLNEPIQLHVELENRSKKPLQFGPLDMRFGKLRFRVLNGAAHEQRQFESAEGQVAGWLEDASTAVQPGDARNADFVLTHYFDLTGPPGTYEVELGWPMNLAQATGEYATVRKAFEVAAPPEGEVERAQSFGAAFAATMDYRIPAESVQKTLTDIASGRDSYLSEAASFYLGHYHECVTIFSDSVEPCEQAVRQYREHQKRYPRSLFAELVRTGIENVEHRKAEKEKRPKDH